MNSLCTKQPLNKGHPYITAIILFHKGGRYRGFHSVTHSPKHGGYKSSVSGTDDQARNEETTRYTSTIGPARHKEQQHEEYAKSGESESSCMCVCVCVCVCVCGCVWVGSVWVGSVCVCVCVVCVCVCVCGVCVCVESVCGVCVCVCVCGECVWGVCVCVCVVCGGLDMIIVT